MNPHTATRADLLARIAELEKRLTEVARHRDWCLETLKLVARAWLGEQRKPEVDEQ